MGSTAVPHGFYCHVYGTAPLHTEAQCVPLLGLSLLELVRGDVGTKRAVHVRKVVPVIEPIQRVMNRMVRCTHNGFALSVDVVVDVGGPDSRRKQKQLYGEEMHGDQVQCPYVRNGLKHTVQRMKGQSRKRRHGVLLVVLVMYVMEVVVQELGLVKHPVHPVHTKLNTAHVRRKIGKEHGNPHFADAGVCFRPSPLHHPFSSAWQEGVQRDRHHRDLDLLQDILLAWFLAGCEVFLAFDFVHPQGPQGT